MNYNPSIKSELLKDTQAVKHHHELVENTNLRLHLALTMQEMQRRASQNTPAENFNACAAAHLRMLGAQEFLDIFYNLAESQEPSTRTDTANLAGNVPTRKN